MSSEIFESAIIVGIGITYGVFFILWHHFALKDIHLNIIKEAEIEAEKYRIKGKPIGPPNTDLNGDPL